MEPDWQPPLHDDIRTVEHFDFCDKKIYRAYNLLSSYDRNNLIEEVEHELEQHEDKWDRCTEVTNYLVNRKLWHMQSWRYFFKLIKKHLYDYSELVGDESIKDLHVASCWAKRMKGVTQKLYDGQLYINYGNVHKHEYFDLGMIYYLKNPSRIYGTLIENEGREIIIPGDENSLLIHHSNINHQPVNPEPLVAQNYYRCVIVVDFVSPLKLEYFKKRNAQ
tara:strand:- start:1870 stop:2529 length:660 start_codon:yes stop_codon:yes gene_type:complete